MFLCEILEKTESKLADRVFDSVAGHPDTLEALLKGCRPDEALLKMLEGTGNRQFFSFYVIFGIEAMLQKNWFKHVMRACQTN